MKKLLPILTLLILSCSSNDSEQVVNMMNNGQKSLANPPTHFIKRETASGIESQERLSPVSPASRH